jgi:hypothetical protein
MSGTSYDITGATNINKEAKIKFLLNIHSVSSSFLTTIERCKTPKSYHEASSITFLPGS